MRLLRSSCISSSFTVWTNNETNPMICGLSKYTESWKDELEDVHGETELCRLTSSSNVSK